MNGEQIEDFSVSQSKMNVPDVRHIHKDLISEIQDDIDDFLTNDCPVFISNTLNEQRSSLPEGQSEFIIEDIRKQINDRIVYYMEQHQVELQNPINENEIYNAILSKLKADIQNTISAYVSNLPKNMKEGNES
jgi:spore germination protein PC